MTIDEWLVAQLDAALPELAHRLYPAMVPMEVPLPAAAYQRLDEVPGAAHDGDTKLNRARFQITIRGGSYEQARTLTARLKSALHARRDVTGTLRVGLAQVETLRDAWGEQLQSHIARTDVILWYNDAD